MLRILRMDILFMIRILHDPIYTIMPYFHFLWYLRSCRISIISSRILYRPSRTRPPKALT